LVEYLYLNKDSTTSAAARAPPAARAISRSCAHRRAISSEESKTGLEQCLDKMGILLERSGG